MRAIDYLLKPFTIEEVEECLKKVRQELEKREVDEWSKKMAADQLLETILQTEWIAHYWKRTSVVFFRKR